MAVKEAKDAVQLKHFEQFFFQAECSASVFDLVDRLSDFLAQRHQGERIGGIAGSSALDGGDGGVGRILTRYRADLWLHEAQIDRPMFEPEEVHDP